MSILSRITYLGILGVIIFSQCDDRPEVEIPIEAKYQAYCGNCHAPPDPKHVTKELWAKNILPEMAARMGYKVGDYNPLAGNNMEEVLYINMSKTYPKNPTIDSVTWNQLYDYVIGLAPDSIPMERERATRNELLSQFELNPISLDENDVSRVTAVKYESESKQFIIGDGFGRGYSWPDQTSVNRQFRSPLISYNKVGGDLYFTEIGYMNPSEIPLGTLFRERKGSIDTLAKKLHRPVFTEVVDLNEDGEMEILICEFGNLTGELSMLNKKGSEYEKTTLLPFPGTINLEIKDMNKDGKKDILVLASQGNEGLYILYQTKDLTFRTRQVIRLSPVFGTSWFETLDYDNDGDLDIVYINGDNADLSIISKPYHGLRLYINDGEDNFMESWFYPVYGATRVLVEDFDLDGDPDFAVMGFFPDFGAVPEEGFIYLENVDPEKYQFKSYTLEGLPLGRWLVMDKGDVDDDGDMDLMLGSFVLPPGRGNRAILDNWIEQKVDVLYLENQEVDMPGQ